MKEYSNFMEGSKITANLTANSLSVQQKERLHEVVDKLLNIYRTLVDMRYIHESALIRGPHALSDESLTTYAKLGLDPAIIYLYSIMPYIDELEIKGPKIFQGSAVFNPTNIRDVEQGRDPCYKCPKGGFEDEEGQYMYPWYTPLSKSDLQSPIIVYDAKEHRIWILDSFDGHTTDPEYCKGWYQDEEIEERTPNKEESNWGDSGSSNWSENDGNEGEDGFSNSASEGSSEFWHDEDDMVGIEEVDVVVADQAEVVDYDEGFEQVQHDELDSWEKQLAEDQAPEVKNRNSLEHVRSRPAGDVLRDITHFYRTLKELPGKGSNYNPPGWATVRKLYLKNGWPDNFSGDQFEIDLARAHATNSARNYAERPLKEIENLVGWIKSSEQQIEGYKRAMIESKTTNDEWNARFALWKAEESIKRNNKKLEIAKEHAEKMCPGGVCQKEQDLPLWQLEQLRWERCWRRERANDPNPFSFIEQGKDDPERMRQHEAGQRHLKRELVIYEQAFRDSEAEAEQLCPGRTFHEATGIKSLGRQDTLTWTALNKEVNERVINSVLIYVQNIHAFRATVPQDASEAAAAVDREIEQNERELRRCREELKRLERSLAEHGNRE